MKGDQRLIQKLVDAPLIGLALIHKQTGQDVKAAILVERLVGGHPGVGLLGRIRQILKEVEHRLLSDLL